MTNAIINTETLEQSLKETGSVHIPSFGTFHIKPRRAGKIGFPHQSSTIKYQNRIVFKPSRVLKDKLCK